MRVLYLDFFSGISGDMFLGALLDLGLSSRGLQRELAKVHLRNYSISIQRATKAGIAGTRFGVQVRADPAGRHAHGGLGSHAHRPHEHRAFREIQKLIRDSVLEDETKRTTLSIFRRLAVAEGRIHGIAPARVRFHEVGAVDSVVDIVGAAVAMRELGEERVWARELEGRRG